MTAQTTAHPAATNMVIDSLLDSIRIDASQLRAKLAAVKADAESALAAMESGRMVPGTHAYGPLGLQTPADIALLTERLQRNAQTASVLGASEERILEAYRAASL